MSDVLVAPSPHSSLRYLPFGLVYGIFAGISGIVMPVIAGDPRVAGTAFALLNLGVALGAPTWGWLSHRFDSKLVLAAATTGAAFCFAALSIPHRAVFLIAAFGFGFGVAASMTLGTIFVISWYARQHWDDQIGDLQTWMGGSQTLGLAITALFFAPHNLIFLGAGVLLLAAVLALTLPTFATQGKTLAPQHASRHPSFPEASGATHMLHIAAFHPRHQWGIVRDATMLRFLTRSGLAMMGSAPLFAIYPLLLRQRFDLASSTTALAFAMATGLAIILYRLAGTWSEKMGTQNVLVLGYGLRGVALLGIALAIFTHAPGVVALVAFALVVLSWPLISVAANARVAEMAPAGSAGAELGSYYTTTMLANVVGGLLSGFIIAAFGYGATMLLSALLLTCSTLWTATEGSGRRTAQPTQPVQTASSR